MNRPENPYQIVRDAVRAAGIADINAILFTTRGKVSDSITRLVLKGLCANGGPIVETPDGRYTARPVRPRYSDDTSLGEVFDKASNTKQRSLAMNCLLGNGYRTVGDVRCSGDRELLKIDGFGAISLRYVRWLIEVETPAPRNGPSPFVPPPVPGPAPPMSRYGSPDDDVRVTFTIRRSDREALGRLATDRVMGEAVADLLRKYRRGQS